MLESESIWLYSVAEKNTLRFIGGSFLFFSFHFIGSLQVSSHGCMAFSITDNSTVCSIVCSG